MSEQDDADPVPPAPLPQQPSLSEWAQAVAIVEDAQANDKAAAEAQLQQQQQQGVNPAADLLSADAATAPSAAPDAAPPQPSADAPPGNALTTKPSPRVVNDGDNVILEVNGDRYSFVHVKKKGRVGLPVPLSRCRHLLTAETLFLEPVLGSLWRMFV